ncbi:monoheme cytochrome C [Allomuricauda sp. d1]|uniref:monoheme cytochrome C n=1 Tax=Allomuricauda sp. d1 TaxID=3136725 RepID=UPI0031E099A9
MKTPFEKQVSMVYKALWGFILLLLVFFGGLFYFNSHPEILRKKPKTIEVLEVTPDDFDKVENGIHVATGFVDDNGMQLVIQNCTSCHSANLVTQNKLSAKGWDATITWMQETQNLWDLGKNRELIVAYLAKNYGPGKKGRRQNLTDVEWYELEQ